MSDYYSSQPQARLVRLGACFLRNRTDRAPGRLMLKRILVRKPANQYLLRSVFPGGGGGDPAVQSAMQFAMYCSFSG